MRKIKKIPEVGYGIDYNEQKVRQKINEIAETVNEIMEKYLVIGQIEGEKEVADTDYLFKGIIKQ